MDKIAQSPWQWTLYGHDGQHYLSVLSGGAAMVEVAIQLTDDEWAAWQATGEAGLKHLIDGIQLKPADFKARKVSLPR